MANDKQNTSPNVPNKREQSGIYSGYAERGELRPQGNVPNLRFPEFTEEWRKDSLKNVASISKGLGISKEQLSDSGLLCILYGELYTKYKSEVITDIYSKTDIETKGLVSSKANDVIIPCSGEAAIEIATARCVPVSNILLGGDLNIIRLNGHDGRFFAYQLNGKRKIDIAKVAQGVSVVHLYGEHLKKIKVAYPSIEEQTKIAEMLSLIDRRISTQNKIIEQLQSLIKGIRVRLFSFDNYDIKYLGDLCSITTGKLDANAMVENGKYPFFTCAEDTFRIDEYAFDTEALLISGNGANLGYIHYYNGKFNAYQRTYVLDKFSVEVMYLKYYLETFLNQRINQEVNVGNTPYIVLSTLTKMKIKIPDISQQRNIINVLSNLNLKLNQEKDILSAYQTQKAYLLRNLFI